MPESAAGEETCEGIARACIFLDIDKGQILVDAGE